MKSTLMSWTSKFGIPDTSRAILARHVSTVATATAVYSRDLLSPVLRQLDVMLASIRSGSFHPDRTRSGMLTPAGMAASAPMTPFVGQTSHVQTCQGDVTPPVQPAEGAHGLGEPCSPGSDGSFQLLGKQDSETGAGDDQPRERADDALADSETSEEGSAQSTSSSEVELEGGEPRMVQFDPPSDFFINNRSLVVHCCRSPGVFKCGRKNGPSFSKIYELSGIRCSRCFDV